MVGLLPVPLVYCDYVQPHTRGHISVAPCVYVFVIDNIVLGELRNEFLDIGPRALAVVHIAGKECLLQYEHIRAGQPEPSALLDIAVAAPFALAAKAAPQWGIVRAR